MKKILTLVSSLLLLPLVASAQNAQAFIGNFLIFINKIIIPTLFGIAFLFFVYNAFRFFVIGGANEEDQEKAKSLALYSVVAFVLLISFWGIVNMFSSSIGLEGCNMPKSDYFLSHFVGPMPPDCP